MNKVIAWVLVMISLSLGIVFTSQINWTYFHGLASLCFWIICVALLLYIKKYSKDDEDE